MITTPNVVWITLESTRTDHTSLSDYVRDTTPNLRRIAERPRGSAFPSCIAHGVWTLASSASILTGTYPSRHGAGMAHDRIPDELETVPELLKEAGYHTACLSPNSHLSSATGLDRGFDDFAWISPSTLLDTAGLSTIARYLLNIRRHGGGITTDTAKHGTGFIVQDVAKRWLRSFAGDREPFFLYAHVGDPHHPYYPPLPLLREYAADLELSAREAGEVALAHHDELNERIARGCDFTAAEWDALHALYDAEIAYADRLVGTLFDYVDSLDLGETVFVVTADHGELFGEHGMLAHKIVVDDAVCRVPLVVYGLDGVEGSDGDLVQHADVVRTLLSAVGARTGQCQGIDLREETREYAVVQRGERRCRRNLERFRELEPDFDVSRYHKSTLTAVRTADYKYQRSADGAELFRLPDEITDVSEGYPDVADRLDGTLSAWLESEGTPVSADARRGEFTDAMKSQLADLGYLVD